MGHTRAALRTETEPSPDQSALRQTLLGLVMSATHVSPKSQDWCSHVMAGLPRAFEEYIPGFNANQDKPGKLSLGLGLEHAPQNGRQRSA